MNPEYRPHPIDTSHVELPEGLGPLVERLAEHIHDSWAQERIDQGWTFGPSRNDDRKEHPCLIPYANLSDNEKRLDRVAALGTLKAILALGGKLEMPHGLVTESSGR